MAVAFTPLSWWLWSGKHQDPKNSNGSPLNSSPDMGLLELDTLKFPLVHGGDMTSSNRKVKRKWPSRGERKIDKEYDVVVVPSDGGCVSGSESDDSDWSIGWLEPHGPGFHSDDDSDDSFAVLVPCYGRGRGNIEESFKDKFVGKFRNIPDIHAAAECVLQLCLALDPNSRTRSTWNSGSLLFRPADIRRLQRHIFNVPCAIEDTKDRDRERERERERENVAESSKECIFMVVGKSHQNKAVKMAGTEPPRIRTTTKTFFCEITDMEEKVEYILKIIDEDGDSFAVRAEMYYRKRPEIINFVEDCFRGYRALAERYDHLSKDLQSANRTIATVYPERVQLGMDEEDEEYLPKTSTPFQGTAKLPKGLPVAPKLDIPKVPNFPKKSSKSPSRLMSKKGLLKLSPTDASEPTKSSGLSKTGALQEIDRLQKGILGLQTEKEFIKSLYESGLAKYWEIENQVTEMQAKVSSLQDEFGIGTVIDDDEARTLMTTTALKSCRETLGRLEKKQKESNEEAKVEYMKIQEAREKFGNLKERLNHKRTHLQEHLGEYKLSNASPDLENMDQADCIGQERHSLEPFQAKIKEGLLVDPDTSLTVSELVEKIDELVDKVIKLEAAVISQNALVVRLRSEANELQTHLKSLEEERESLIQGSDKIKELEQELGRVETLKKSAKEQMKNLQTSFAEASSNFDHLSEIMPHVKRDEELEHIVLFNEMKSLPAVDKPKQFQVDEDMISPHNLFELPKDIKSEAEKEDQALYQITNVKFEAKEFLEQHKSGNPFIDLSQPISGSNTEEVLEEYEVSDSAGFEKVISNDVRVKTELKSDEMINSMSPVKADEENFVQSNLCNYLADILPKDQVRTVLDASPEDGSKESEDMMAHGSVLHDLQDVRMEEEAKKEGTYLNAKEEVVQCSQANHPDQPLLEGLPEAAQVVNWEEGPKYSEDMVHSSYVGQRLLQSNQSNHLDDLSFKGQGEAVSDENPEKGFKDHEDMLATGHDSESSEYVKLGDGTILSKDDEEEKGSKEYGDLSVISREMKSEEEKNDGIPENGSSAKIKDEQHHVHFNSDNHRDDQALKKEEQPSSDEEGEPDWRQLFLNGLEDREKMLLQEYTSILRNFKEVKKKLTEVEKKNRASLFKSAVQLKVLKNANAMKDLEIRSLHRKMDLLQTDLDVTPNTHLQVSDTSSPKAVSELLSEQTVGSTERTEETQAEQQKDEVKVIPSDEPHEVSIIEEKIRMDIDDLLEENIEFWLKFSTSVHQIQKFQTSYQDLQEELVKLKENKKQDGSTKHQSPKHQSPSSDIRAIYKHLSEIQTELTLWLEHNGVLKEDLQNRLSSLSNIQDEISRLSSAGSQIEETQLSDYQAAKFQGEIMNMKQENKKVEDELLAGLEHVKRLQEDIAKTLAKLDEEFGISPAKNHQTKNPSRSKIPLRSFLFGVKLKKQNKSIFACMSPALQKQYSDLTALPP
ncbi:hypothetical protein RJ640_023516 [Escallonia rubra]|uniref:NAB domain-containing protein n=1 Tax=Escallonia rubra TaxID=112253 RepID=A0AA88R2K9_9ASTE|nr:hypothetical protein RJ640_023516 [Escallonia rubra]